MKTSSELLKKYKTLSEELFSLNIELEFDRADELIMQREEILEELRKQGISEEDKKTVALSIMDLDRKILEKFEEQKSKVQENLGKVKREKRKHSNKRKAFNVYGEDKGLEKNVFFDKRK